MKIEEALQLGLTFQFGNHRYKRQLHARSSGVFGSSLPDAELKDAMLRPWCSKLPSEGRWGGGGLESSAG